MVKVLGATYHSADVSELGFEPDIIVECTGVGQVIAECNVAAGGIVCLTGVGGCAAAGVATGDVAAGAVLKNNVVVGSVNANKRHWCEASLGSRGSGMAWPPDYPASETRTAMASSSNTGKIALLPSPDSNNHVAHPVLVVLVDDRIHNRVG